MSNARRPRAERRAAIASRVAQTAPVGGRPRRSPLPAVNAATGPAGNEQQASLQHPSVRQNGRTATPSLTPAGSSSRALRAPLEARAALITANELLRYRPVDDVYEEWLDRVAELVRAAGGSPAPSAPPRRTPPRVGNEAPGAFQPPPLQEAPWSQGAQLLGGTRSVKRQPSRNGAAKKSRDRKRLPGRSQLRFAETPLRLRRVKTPGCSQLRRMGTHKAKLSLNQNLPRSPQVAAPTPPNCAASHGPASSSRTCLHSTMERLTPRSSSSSTSWGSKPPAGTKRSWSTGSPWR